MSSRAVLGLIDVKSWLKSNPWLFYLASRNNYREGFRKRAIDPSCELVIEGFPRSANSFCVEAFLCAQDHPIRVANHCHTPSQFVLAARWGVPALLLVREPEETVISNMILGGLENPAPILNRYIAFHRPLLKLKPHMVIADFSEVTSDLGSVTARINEKFSTNFSLFENSQENMKKVRQGLAQTVERRAAQDRKSVGQLPSREKEAQKGHLRAILRGANLEQQMSRATALYKELRSRDGRAEENRFGGG